MNVGFFRRRRPVTKWGRSSFSCTPYNFFQFNISFPLHWAHSINLDFVDFTDFWMSWLIRLILISFCFRRFANQWNLRNPAPELDFSQISLISCARETWKLNLKAESSSGSNVLRIVVCYWPRLALTLLWVWPRRCRTWRKRNVPRSRAPAHVWTAGADEANKVFTPVERRGRWAGLFHQGQGEEVCKGKAMARRRLQRRCETKGRRLKTTQCTWSGSFHDELWCEPARLTTLVARSKNGVIWICYMLWSSNFQGISRNYYSF